MFTADAIVAQDGSGHYTSIQEAIWRAPARPSKGDKRWIILVKPGTYREIVYVQREVTNIDIVGEDPERTVLTYGLGATMPGPNGKPMGTFRTPTLYVDADGLIIENLTVSNTAGGNSGQGLALRVDADRVVFKNCRFLGWQDTILLNRGRQYFEDCTIEGVVDFIFGGATAFFQHCEIRCIYSEWGEVITAASTPEDQPYGFVFRDCRITGAVPDGKAWLGRPWRRFAKVVYINTDMAAVVKPVGWDNWDNKQAERSAYYAEYHSTGPGANPGARAPWAKQLTDTQASSYTVSNVLAGCDGWVPSPPILPSTK